MITCSNLDSFVAVFLVTRHNSQRMNKMIGRIKIDRTRITQTVKTQQDGKEEMVGRMNVGINI